MVFAVIDGVSSESTLWQFQTAGGSSGGGPSGGGGKGKGKKK